MKITSLVCVLLFACTLLPAQVAPGFAKGSAAQTGNSRSHAAQAQPGSALPMFGTATVFPSGGYGAQSVAVADVNKDGIPDLIVSNRCTTGNNQCNNSSTAAGVVGVLLGNGDGTFQTAVTYSTGAVEGRGIAVADLNKDGNPDVIVANLVGGFSNFDGAVSVLLGNGDGTFKTAVVYDAGGQAYAITVADMNGDGNPDVVVGNTGPTSNVSVLLGNGDGTLQPASAIGSGGQWTHSIATASLSGGLPDVLTSIECATGNCSGQIGLMGVLSNVSGTLQSATDYDAVGGFAEAVAAADVNGDGKIDAIVASDDCTSGCTNSGVGILLGNGDGTFQPVGVGYDPGGNTVLSVGAWDVNGDGIPDLVVGSFCVDTKCTTGIVSVLLGNGDGTYQTATIYGAGGGDTFFALAADVNGDGEPDLIVANECVGGTACGNGGIGVLLHQDFTVAATALNPSPLSPGSSATSTITIAPAIGYSNNVNLKCAVNGVGSPLPTCVFTSSQITGASGTTTLTVNTTGSTTAVQPSPNLFYAALLPIVGVLMIGSASARRKKGAAFYMLLCLTAAGLFILPSCGGGSSSSGGGGGGSCSGCTPAGNYTIIVTATDATSSKVTHTLSPTLTLTVN